MRKLEDVDISDTLPLEVYSVMQLYAINKPLLPNLTTLRLWRIGKPLIQFIPLFLSPRITSISFEFSSSSPPESMIASVITILPMSCPNLQHIDLRSLPSDPMITAAVSRMPLDIDQNALLAFHVDIALTEEASEVVYKSQNLRSLSVAVRKGTSIPSVSLPNLTHLKIRCADGSNGLQLLRGATFGKLESVSFDIKSKPTGNFLEAFKDAALSSSIQDTLSVFILTTRWSLYPNYSSLLPFTQLVHLTFSFPCDDSCSRVDDDTVIGLSRAMPRLECLCLGYGPCYRFTGGVTAKGLMALAYNCPNIDSLCVHFQVASLGDPPTGGETIPKAGYSASWTGSALRVLEVGVMPVPEELVPMVALTLLRIFPRIEFIGQAEDEWDEVNDLIRRSKQIVDRSSKYHLHTMDKFLAYPS